MTVTGLKNWTTSTRLLSKERMPRIASFSSAALYDMYQSRSSFVALPLRSTHIRVGGKGKIECFVFGAYLQLVPSGIHLNDSDMDQSPQHDSFGSSDTSPPHSSTRPTALRPRGKRGPLPSSCKECRRLKLRCNVRESLPCENCQKRGRAHLCPDGSLYTIPRIVK